VSFLANLPFPGKGRAGVAQKFAKQISGNNATISAFEFGGKLFKASGPVNRLSVGEPFEKTISCLSNSM
jgi:hypothetical protein